MSLKQILEYRIIDLDNFHLTPYHLILATVIIIVARFIVMGVRLLIFRKALAEKLDPGQKNAIYQITKYIIYLITLVLVLDSVGIQVTLLVASASALFLALALGLQQLFTDLVAGFIMLFDRSIAVDDIVEVDGTIGKIQKIGLRSSLVLTRENINMIIPNSKFIKEKVVNWSHNKQPTRFKISVGVAYGSDTQLVKKVLLDCTRDHKDILKTPPPFVRFNNFGDSSLDFELFFFSNGLFYIENVKSDIRFRIDQQFREHGVRIPFPQRDLHLMTVPSDLKQ